MKKECIENRFGRFWYVDGLLHREDGPAIEHKMNLPDAVEDCKVWYRGPRSSTNYEEVRRIWYYRGKKVDCKSQEEFEKFLRFKAFW